MIIEAPFYNVKCDVCGEVVDDYWYNNKHDAETNALDNAGFRYLGGKHYCPDCWTIDDDDHVATKDGKKYDDETEEEII